jgi:hypothetical protein
MKTLKSIRTKQEFHDALCAASPRADAELQSLSPIKEPGTEYQLWGVLLRLVHAAIDAADWNAVRSLLALYDAVERAGKRGEMYESSYVAFLEDVTLPKDPAALRQFWRHAPPLFTTAIQKDRGLR